MNHLIGAVLNLGYLALFLFLISRMKFFRIGNIPIRWFQGVFVLKVLSGFLLYLIYTYYYTDRSTADIWKYYDDGMVMFSALRQHPADYFKMLFGVMNDTPHFQQYYDTMNHWYRPYGSSIANDTHTIIRFNAFVRLFSLGHYNVHSVVANFLGLIGLTGILHFLKQMAPSKEKWFFAGVFLMPGMMFWASGVLKEPLLLFGLGLFLFGVMKIVNDGFSIKEVVLIVLSLFFLVTVKSFALAAIGIGLVGWLLARRFQTVHPSIWFLAVFSIGFFGLILMAQVFPDKSLFARMAQRQHEFYELAAGGTYIETSAKDTLYIGAENYDDLEFISDRKKLVTNSDITAVYWKDARQENVATYSLAKGSEQTVLLDYGKTGSTIDIPKLEPTAWSVLKAAPIAFVNATFRPFPWDISSPFMVLSGLENLLVILLSILAIVGVCRGKPLLDSTWYLAASFALVILVLTGLVTPVVGAIVRYKVISLPFLTSALLSAVNTPRIERYALGKFPVLKKYF
ncbi:MAG: hypothetical protein K9G46_11790 [Flavobacteriales bacterium]|nr:hypothetical protein [Flavobacteriales bacterium]